jgi:hypothetical protein
MSLRSGIAEGTLRVRVLRCREKAVALREELMGIPLPKDRNTPARKAPNKAEG